MTSHRPETGRVRRRFAWSQHIHAAPEAVFPLLCPVREYDWIPEWDCRLVYSESGLAELGCIFQTDRETDGGLDTWVISRHEPNQHIAFVRTNHLRVMQYCIHLASTDRNQSCLTWTQVVTALNEAGDRHVASLKQEDFTQTIRELEKLLNDFLVGRE